MHLLFDIGGTKTRLAVSEGGDNISKPLIFPTLQDFSEGMAKFKQSCEDVLAGKGVQFAVGGIAGALNKERTDMLKSPHLPDWTGKSLKQTISHALGVETYIENDTAMVGLGEAVFGAGKSYDIVAYITISTGVGGSRIVNKKIDPNIFGFEPGHQVIDADGTMCPNCTAFEDGKLVGHLEAHVSGAALEKRCGKLPTEIEDEKVWDDVAKYLAYGLNNTVVHWSPEVVILGGGMMKPGGIDIDKVRKYLNDILKIFPEKPQIVLAQLGDVGGLYGALHYANHL